MTEHQPGSVAAGGTPATSSATERTGRAVTAAVALAATAYPAWLLSDVSAPRTEQLVSDLAFVLAALTAAVCCGQAARRNQGRRRRAWALLCATATSWTVGNLLWLWYQFGADHQPFPGLNDVFYLVALVLAPAGLLSFPAAPARLSSLVQTLLDGLIVATSLLFLSWTAVLGPLLATDARSALERTVYLAYPVGDVALASIAAFLVLRAGPALRRPLLLAAAGLALYCLADSGYAYLTAHGHYTIGTVVDAGWVLGYLLLARAALVPCVGGADEQAGEARPSLLRAAIPYLVLLVVTGVVAVKRITPDGEPFLFWTAAALLVLVAARQFLVLLENVSMARDLEAKVAQRTAELRSADEHVRWLAFHDALTDLPNRALFQQRLARVIEAGDGRGGSAAVLVVDLDGFKEVNDTLSHGAGDRLLVVVAERIRSCLRTGDTASRLGGDEFAVLLEGGDRGGAERVARRVVQACRVPLTLDDRELLPFASVGVAVAAPGQSVEEVLRDADAAMYAAKQAGGNQHQVYQLGMHAEVLSRLELSADLRGAVERDELTLHYQPIVATSTGRIVGLEALVRWNHPRRGLVPPADFIPIAEQSGLILVIGRWVLRNACRQLVAWQAAHPGSALHVSVNVAVRQLRDRGFVEEVGAILDETGLAAADLFLEITETSIVSDFDDTVSTLQQLKDLGVRLSIDDFGTGYSSLSYLRRLPVDVVKIDRSFVQGIATSPDEWALAVAVIRLVRALSLDTVAEGVEGAGQLAHLRALGCEYAQGYYFARPQGPAAVAALLAEQTTDDELAVG